MIITPIPGFSEPFSSISHLLGALVFFVASFFLIYRGRRNNSRVIGLIIYSFSLVFLLAMSGIYHLLDKGSKASYVLHVLDYCAIYALIAGTFTPIHLILFRGLHRWLVLSVAWTFSIIALTLTSIFFENIPHYVSLITFLVLGWMGAITMFSIYKMHARKLLKYLILGGVFYTLGAVIEFSEKPIIINGVFASHEIFHLFVLIAAFFHWRLVYEIAKYPISSKIIIVVRQLSGNKFDARAMNENACFEGSSIEDIKIKVNEWLEREYTTNMRPELINYKYTREEDLIL